MDAQTLINIFVGLAGGLGGWILNSMKSDMMEQRKDLTELTDKVHSIDVLVAGTYVKRDDMEKLSTAIFAKLDRIEAKLDSKVDK
jgi:hypothetical protein